MQSILAVGLWIVVCAMLENPRLRRAQRARQGNSEARCNPKQNEVSAPLLSKPL
jgi:hypothetical protein